MITRIAYLHGLESNNKGSKNDWLRTIAEVYDPLIDYYQQNIYQDIKNGIEVFKPDLIAGSSMGGYFAYELAKELNIPALLFNPALHSRSFTPDMTGNANGNYKPEIFSMFGQNDELINPLKTIEILSEDGYSMSHYLILSHGHRTPFEVFTRGIENILSKIS